MQPSDGQSPLPSSPLPPSPYQQTYSPETGLTFSPTPSALPPASPPPPKPRKVAAKVAPVVFIIAIFLVILAAAGELNFLFDPSGSSNGPTVQVTSTSASHVCPYSGTPTETFLFTLVNGGSVDAVATIGFYLNDVQVHSGTYSAPAGASTPYTVTAGLASCPPSGSTYYLKLVSVSAA